MGKGAVLRWAENKVIERYLHGRGVEIGALWKPFPVPNGVKVYYIDRRDGNALRREYPELKSLVDPDVVADAAQLPFASESLDFVIASHILEHMPFPLAALALWYSALRPGGVLVLKVPDKRYTFDRDRARTTLQHLVDEHLSPARFDKRAHFEDWVQNVGGRERDSPVFELETNHLMETDYSIHYHVWTDEDVREIVRYTRKRMGLKWTDLIFLSARFYRKECVLALRRG